MGKTKVASVLIALVYIALGVLFIVRPQGVEEALCYVLAGAVALLGVLYLLGYFIMSSQADDDQRSNGFAIGVLLIMLAVFIAVKQDLIIELVPFLFGVMVMVRGLFIIQTAFAVRRMGLPIGFPLIMGLVIMAFGLFLMLFPMEMGQTLLMLIGCGLIAAGLSGIIEMISVGSMQRRRENEKERFRDMGPEVTTYEDKLKDDEEATGDQAGEAPEAPEKAEAPEKSAPAGSAEE